MCPAKFEWVVSPHAFNLLKSFTSVFMLILHSTMIMFETSKNVSLAQKSGFIFKNSCSLMVIIIVHFVTMNIVSKKKPQIRSIGPGKGSDQ